MQGCVQFISAPCSLRYSFMCEYFSYMLFCTLQLQILRKKALSKPTFKLQVSIKSTIYYSPPQPAADNHKDKN